MDDGRILQSRRGQAVLEALLVFATYAAAAFILVSASRGALLRLDLEESGRVAPLSSASLACVTFGSYSLRSSTASLGFPFASGVVGANLAQYLQEVKCPVRMSGAESAIVSDLSEGVPTA